MATEPAKTSSHKTHKNHHITNIRYPYAKTWDKRNTSIEFELANVHFSTSNAIRRLMLSHVKTVGFRTEPYKECDINVIVNDTPLHNQIMVHRLAMIPINVPSPEKIDINDFSFIINVVNNTNIIRPITTEDFQIKQISTNKMLSRDEVKKFFPPDTITGDYILLTKLRPKYFVPSKNVSQEVVAEMAKDYDKPVDEPMTFNIEAKASVSNGFENGHYCPVACACYINTVDPQRAEIGMKEYIEKQNEIAKMQDTAPIDMEILKRRFELTERARFYYVNDKNEPNVFTFKIESVGVIPPLIIFHRAIDILKDKINTFISNLVAGNENSVVISASNQLNGGYNIIVKNEDDTLGNIIQSHLCMLYADYTLPKEQRKLKYVGYKRPHPLEKHIIFAVQGNNDNLEALIGEVLKPGCLEIVKMLNKIQNELEGTTYFVNELKMIQ
jgi:DNA-directed RNA polymerase subunit L